MSSVLSMYLIRWHPWDSVCPAGWRVSFGCYVIRTVYGWIRMTYLDSICFYCYSDISLEVLYCFFKLYSCSYNNIRGVTSKPAYAFATYYVPRILYATHYVPWCQVDNLWPCLTFQFLFFLKTSISKITNFNFLYFPVFLRMYVGHR